MVTDLDSVSPKSAAPKRSPPSSLLSGLRLTELASFRDFQVVSLHFEPQTPVQSAIVTFFRPRFL